MTTPVRDNTGKFKPTVGSHIDSKGYLVLTCGTHRKVRLHRLLGAFKMGRPLTKDEDVHHANGDKLDFSYENIVVLGHKEHGCVSAKQHHYVKTHDIKMKNKWDEFFEQEAESQ